MVEPATMMALGQGAGALGSLFGAFTQNKNAKLANQIALLNYYSQDRAARVQEELGRESLAMSKAPVTTGTGTRSSYEPGVGFKTELSPLEAAIIGGTQSQNATSATAGVARRPALEEADFRQSGRASGIVDALMSRLDSPSSLSPEGIAAEMRLADRRGVGAVNADTIRELAGSAIRRGGVGADNTLRRAMGGGLNETFANNRPYTLEADEVFRNRRSNEGANNVNLINALRGISKPGALPMPAQSAADGTTAAMRNTAPQAYGVAINSITAPQMGQMKDSYGLSNFFNSAGAALYGYGQNREFSELAKAMSNRQKQ